MLLIKKDQKKFSNLLKNFYETKPRKFKRNFELKINQVSRCKLGELGGGGGEGEMILAIANRQFLFHTKGNPLIFQNFST